MVALHAVSRHYEGAAIAGQECWQWGPAVQANSPGPAASQAALQVYGGEGREGEGQGEGRE